MKIIFCNIGWMERYQGLSETDQITGGGAYVVEEQHGVEVCNFAPSGGFLYGNVQPRGRQINIKRIGAKRGDTEISGVTVFWTASRPTGGTVIIGWYKNATVFLDPQPISKHAKLHRRNSVESYWIRTRSNQGALLPVDRRTLEIPRRVRGGMGQSNVWYADSDNSLINEVVNDALKLVRGKRTKPASAKGRRGKQDQDRKVQIEWAAIALCRKYFEDLGYEVKTVEKDNRGWDLEAKSGRTLLQIEVKGLSGDSIAVELTPNEYNAFSEKSDRYRLSVVTNALESPKLFVCRFSKERNAWIVNDSLDGVLKIDIKESAAITIRTRKGSLPKYLTVH